METEEYQNGWQVLMAEWAERMAGRTREEEMPPEPSHEAPTYPPEGECGRWFALGRKPAS